MDPAIFKKAAAYCAYQERSHREVLDRLRKWNVYGEEAEIILAELISGGYLNEERFAKAFAGGKSRMLQWGRNKIKRELEAKGVSDYSIEQGLKEIDDQDYRAGLEELVRKKWAQLRRAENSVKKNQMKLYRYAQAKGYEFQLTKDVLEEILKEYDNFENIKIKQLKI